MEVQIPNGRRGRAMWWWFGIRGISTDAWFLRNIFSLALFTERTPRNKWRQEQWALLLPRSWFLTTVPNRKEPVLLGNGLVPRMEQEIDKVNLGHLSEKIRNCFRNGKDMWFYMGQRSQPQRGHTGYIWNTLFEQQNKKWQKWIIIHWIF